MLVNLREQILSEQLYKISILIFESRPIKLTVPNGTYLSSNIQ